MLNCFLIIIFLVGCQKTQVDNNNYDLILSTTTSTENSGLLDYLLPQFEKETGIKTKVIAVGTGKAIQMGVDGMADVLLVHDRILEEKFVANGDGLKRYDVMYNDFVLLGPDNNNQVFFKDIKNDIVKALKTIAENNLVFLSRGDNSGTHNMELRLFKEAGFEEPFGKWYKSVGKGMGDTINMTDELLGYTLSDRATYLSTKHNLKIIVENDSKLFNPYSIIAVNPNKNNMINNDAAEKLIQFFISERGQNLIGEFGKDKFGQSLFIPNAK